MKIIRAGSTPSAPGPEDYFTGTVRIDPMFQADAPGRKSPVCPAQPGLSYFTLPVCLWPVVAG